MSLTVGRGRALDFRQSPAMTSVNRDVFGSLIYSKQTVSGLK